MQKNREGHADDTLRIKVTRKVDTHEVQGHIPYDNNEISTALWTRSAEQLNEEHIGHMCSRNALGSMVKGY